MNSAINDGVYQPYLQALLDGERQACADTVRALLGEGVELKDLYLNLFQRSMYQVGELWESEQISVATEHLATAVTERMLTLVQATVFAGPAREHSIVVACVADEYHQLGARMVADFCELRGWRGAFLGANTPLPDLLKVIDQRRPTLLGLSLSLNLNLSALMRAVAGVRGRFAQLPIVVGGQALRWGGLQALADCPGVSCVDSLDALEHAMLAHEH